MARNQRKYNTGYKMQAVKLSNEIGSSKAAVEWGIPVDTLYGWVRAVKEGRYRYDRRSTTRLSRWNFT